MVVEMGAHMTDAHLPHGQDNAIVVGPDAGTATLPHLHRPPERTAASLPAPVPGAISVLLVNDDPGTLFALRAVLTDLDAALVSVTSGEQALICLLRQDFVVILLDVKMTGMDGFETARLIRQRPRSHDTPILFLTSHRATDIDRAIGFGLGAVDYLFMPVAPEMLRAKVQAFVDLEQARRLLAAQGEPVRARRGPANLSSLYQALRREADAAQYADSVPHSSAGEPLIVEQAGDFVALLDAAGCWLYAGASYRREFGAAAGTGQSYVDLVAPEDRATVAAALAALTPADPKRRLQYRVLGQAAHFFESEVMLAESGDEASGQRLLVSRDVTERKEMEAYVLQQSFHDSLTGLPNRLLLLDRLSQATALRERLHPTVAVLFIDLDHFKAVNDTLGHAAGDRLLQDVAERLSGCVRAGDTVARLGGDEFVVMLLGLHDAGYAGSVASKIVDAVSAACHIDGRELSVTPSIGIAIFPDDASDVEALLRNADIAMYHAKRDGGGRFCYFAAQMQEAANRKLSLGNALQRAIAGDEFRLHYQPKVDARSGAICGFEALMRWPQAVGEPISPAVFIPVAEETGRIEQIGALAIAQSVAQLQCFAGHGFGAVPVAVNLSALQLLRADLCASLAAVLEAAGVAPALLELELTESAMMSNPARAVQTLGQIHALGMHVSIDDFGTGYSSLSYLKRLPIDHLKIDASFVHDIANDPSDAAIVLAIITLGHVLHLTVIAEGVETAAQVAFLRAHGCDQLQGFYFSPAVAPDDALAMLRRGPFALAPLEVNDALH